MIMDAEQTILITHGASGCVFKDWTAGNKHEKAASPFFFVFDSADR